MNCSVSFGSWPSKPTMMSLLIRGFACVFLRRKRHTIRKGQMRSDAIAIRIVVNTTRNDDSSAKPAPGPM